MFFLRKLIVKDLKILFNGPILSFKGTFDPFDFRFILSKSFQNLFSLYTGPFDTKRIFYGVFFKKIEDFHSLKIEFFVN